MHDRPEPDGVEPTPYLPAWLDAHQDASYDTQYGSQYGAQHGSQHGIQYDAQQGAQYDTQYGAQYEAHYGSPQYGAADFGDVPSPYQQLERYEPYDYGGPTDAYGRGGHPQQSLQYGIDPANAHGNQQYYPRRPREEQASSALVPREPAEAEPALVPTRGERRAAQGRGFLGGPMRALLALAVLACLGAFGYWGWAMYEGKSPGVREGNCIAALDGSDVKPVDCSGPDARFTVLEVFKGASDASTCAVVLGATNPVVVHREGRTDVWCVAPNTAN